MSTVRFCPVCGGVEKNRLYQQSFEGSSFGNGYTVVACDICGAIFSDNIPTQKELDDYYKCESKYENSVSDGFASPCDIQRFEKIVDQVEEFIDCNSSILDIGCSTGGLLSVFKRRGYGRIKGIDPSPTCAALARQNYGVDVDVGTFASLAQWKDNFRMITLVGVLEHIREVKEVMELLVQRIAPEGSLLIAVPDAEEFATVRNAPFQQFSIEHINFFTQNSLNSLARSFGLRPASVRRYSVQWSSDVKEPILSIVYKKGSPQSARYDFDGLPAIKKYIEYSLRNDSAIQDRLSRFVNSGSPLIIWGTGALARRLLSKPVFRNLNVVAFVDSDPRQQGKYLMGKRIIGPKELTGHEPILVCSVARESEIGATIKQLAIKNEVILLGAAL